MGKQAEGNSILDRVAGASIEAILSDCGGKPTRTVDGIEARKHRRQEPTAIAHSAPLDEVSEVCFVKN